MIKDDEDEIINSVELLHVEQENDFFGFEASKTKVLSIQENNIDAKIKYAANRVFVNNGDSYHGKYIIKKIREINWNCVNAEVGNNKPLENNVSNEELEGRELQQDQNVTLTNDGTVIEKEKEEKEISDQAYVKVSQENDVSNVELQPINNETPLINNRPIIPIVINHENETRKYDIVTTITKKSHIYNEKYNHLKDLTRVIVPNNKKLLMNEIKKCAIVVYDISLDKNQITEAYTALQKITEEIHMFKNRAPNAPNGMCSAAAENRGIRVFILVSSLLTWGLTKKQNEIPMTQADYKRRVCHPNFEEHYKLENYLLLLNDKYRAYFHGIVFAPGLVYGHGEIALKYIYETAFNDTEQLLIPNHDSPLPIIHVENLAEIVSNLVRYHDRLTEPYVVGVETTRYSLRNVTEAVKNEVQKKDFVYCDYSSLFQNALVTQTVYDAVTMSIDLVPYPDNYITQFLYSDQSVPRMFTETVTLVSEYLKTKPKMKQIIISGPQEVKEFAKRLARTYELDYIDPVTISEEFLNLLENSFENNDLCVWLENFINNGFAYQTPSTVPDKNSTISIKPSSKLANKNLFKEQTKYFDDKGQISDKYLLPFIKYKLSNNRRKNYGYIMGNFPETTKQARSLFNLEGFVSPNENGNIFEIDINPTIVIDVVMVGKNLIDKVARKSSTGQPDCSGPRLLSDAGPDKSHGWLSLGSKYTEDKIVEHILENDNTEIRKNSRLVDYLEECLKPKVFKEYIVITKDNFATINPERFDELFQSILTCFPVKLKVEDVASCVLDKTIIDNIMRDAERPIITNVKVEKEDDIKENNLARLSKYETNKKQVHVSPENSTIVNFLVKSVNPVLVKGILEIINKSPKDPVDFLAQYIYNQNKYNPCVPAPPKAILRVRNSFNKHML